MDELLEPSTEAASDLTLESMLRPQLATVDTVEDVQDDEAPELAAITGSDTAPGVSEDPSNR